MSHKLLHLSKWILFLGCVVATSSAPNGNSDTIPASMLQSILSQPLPAMQKGMDAPSLVEMIMFGLAGIPVYKAVGLLLPFLMSKRPQAKQKHAGRVYQQHSRNKRDLAYAHQLLNLLITVEVALEKYGITEPQCQLRATCEIHKKNTNVASGGSSFERNFIKLISEMRREIKNPKVIPLAKYVFEYYEEAAERGDKQRDCKELYSKCPHSLDHFLRKTKGKKPRKYF